MISLWMCKNAIYKENDYLKCAKGHELGLVHSRMVQRGKPLVCRTCQNCPDCDIMGDDIQKSERGWE